MNEFLRGILVGINSVIHNYGWSIVVFTLLIRVIIVPFDYKSRLSMRKTQKIQPKINALQKKYANDKEKLNLKMNELYKKEKINPLSSCLPILLTMPILFAMFAAMRMVANEQVVQQVMDMLQGKAPEMQGWLWVRNLWMPDSPFAGQLPDLNTLRMIPADIWQRMITGENLEWLMTTFGFAEDCLSGANLNSTIVTLNAALQETEFYVNTGVLDGWTFNLFIASFSIMKDMNGYFILPLMACLTQVLMTKLTPSQPAPEKDAQGNPVNKQNNMGFMNWFFPLFSLYICASSNAAFSLYWVAANVIAVVENIVINKYLDAKEAKELLMSNEGGTVK